jgi:hypothetical protein
MEITVVFHPDQWIFNRDLSSVCFDSRTSRKREHTVIDIFNIEKDKKEIKRSE